MLVHHIHSINEHCDSYQLSETKNLCLLHIIELHSIQGTRLAQLEDHAALDLRVTNSSPMVGIEITSINQLKKFLKKELHSIL